MLQPHFWSKIMLWGPIDPRGAIRVERAGPMAQYPVQG